MDDYYDIDIFEDILTQSGCKDKILKANDAELPKIASKIISKVQRIYNQYSQRY